MFNRVALVTGASRGIGRAIALLLSRSGYHVVAAATTIEENRELLEELRSGGGEPMAVNVDISSQDSVKQAFGRALQAKGRIDILVNNAGITRDGLAVRMKAADWDRVLRVNLDGAFHAMQQVVPGMMKNRWGRIIN